MVNTFNSSLYKTAINGINWTSVCLFIISTIKLIVCLFLLDDYDNWCLILGIIIGIVLFLATAMGFVAVVLTIFKNPQVSLIPQMCYYLEYCAIVILGLSLILCFVILLFSIENFSTKSTTDLKNLYIMNLIISGACLTAAIVNAVIFQIYIIE